MTTNYEIPDGPKMLCETLCVAQSRIANSPDIFEGRQREHIERLQRLIDACDTHRPLGPDGKHGDLHTPTCGCEDVVVPTPTSEKRAALDTAIADVLPISGGQVRRCLKKLRRALAELDETRRPCMQRGCGHTRNWHRETGCAGDLLHCPCSGFQEGEALADQAVSANGGAS